MLLLLSVAAFADPTLAIVEGTCPGRVRIEVSDLTPRWDAEFYVGLEPGDDLLARGRCAGTETGLGGDIFLASIRTPDDGVLRIEPTLPPIACDKVLQVVDGFDCATSNVIDLADPDDPVDAGPACAFDPEAEHPAYTTPAVDVALCGNNYTDADADAACGAGWHVCREAEWQDRFPNAGPPLGAVSSFDADQYDRCTGGVWIADAPDSDRIWDGDVCESAYNPWNSYKCLYDDDGGGLLTGSGGCCGWDSHGGWSEYSSGSCAIYCCRG